MKKLGSRRSAAMLITVLVPLTLLIASSILHRPATAQGVRAWTKDVNLRERQSRLASRLSSTRRAEFREALASLAALDEPGALDIWQAALDNPDSELRKEAWIRFKGVREALARKETVPQVARIAAPKDEVLRHANAAGMEVHIWSEDDGRTIAAAPPYLLEYFRHLGLDPVVLYDSIADWQMSRSRGDMDARAITPDYQSDDADSKTQIRIAVIDLSSKGEPAPGYSDWLGDRENVLMSNDSFIAYLDIFSSDGSESSINSRVENQYNRRGYRLAGFYTATEFAGAVAHFFPGRTFDAGSPAGTSQSIELQMATAEGKFHSYEETLAEFKSLAESHPNLARLVNLGQSYEGRQIFALKVSKDAGVDDASKIDVLITGGHHAREWVSIEPPIYFANQLIRGFETDDRIRHLLNRLQIWIVPIINPDGLVFSQSAPNDEMSNARLWRKNRRPVSMPGCGAGVGVDLNRNYNFHWRLEGDQPCPEYFDDRGGSDEPGHELYRGPKAESEPEVRALKSLIDDPNRRFRAHLDYHNFSQLILYPWGYQRHKTPDANVLGSLAERMSDEIFSVHGQRYTTRQAFDLYITSGASVDYSYGVDGIPVPFVIEMRPVCCKFNVPESEIAPINEENWAGARMIMEWAAGPPILESVKAYQKAPDGSFSKLIYSAHWSPVGAARLMVVDTRFPVIEPGPLKVQVRFSKPMDDASPIKATLGRAAGFDEVRFEAKDESQGWGKTVYANDTWTGETVIPEGGDLANAWQLAISAMDRAGLNLDAIPETIADYRAGFGGWQNYEDSNGEQQSGGVDIQHALSPSIREGFAFIFVGAPVSGERLAGGGSYTVTWTVSKSESFVPSEHQIWLSTDGGENFARIVEGIPGDVDKFQFALPFVATNRARIRVLARETSRGNIVLSDNPGDFTIGANVNSAVAIKFVSSEKVDANWSDTGAVLANGSSRLIINLSLTNHSNTPIANPFLQVTDLTRGNVLLSRDVKSKSIIGALQSIDAGGDNLLSPGETVQARMEVGLVIHKKFVLWVNLCGVPVDGTIQPASSVRVWKGKPKNK